MREIGDQEECIVNLLRETVGLVCIIRQTFMCSETIGGMHFTATNPLVFAYLCSFRWILLKVFQE